jgi:GntR family transcriptional regulator/MocR family aminotransferase
MLWLRLDGEGPLHRQVYRGLRAALLEGRLAAGARLPATRALAQELGVSRNTVLAACEQLIAEGYAEARPRAGTFAAAALPAPERPRARDGVRHALRLSAIGARIGRGGPPGRVTWNPRNEPLPFDFRYGEPSYADLPLETWARLLGRRARRLSARRLAYQAPGGAPELRRALAAYLARARGVVTDPDRIVIVRGSQQAIDLVARLLIDPGSRVVIEEPHYAGFALCLRAAGAELAPVGVDAEGLDTRALERVRGARLVCVTPSHQYPTGEVMSLARRLALLAWARRADALVLEDDYDGEFRFDGRPIACLQALDRDERVIYVGTASKLLFPALRIGWIVAPPALVPHLLDAQALSDTGTPSLEQLALADFIAEGHLERHARRARKRTAARRGALLDAIARQLRDHARVRGASAGLHVLLELPGIRARDAARLRDACRRRGVGVYSAAPFYEKPPAHAELLIGYAALRERQIREGIRRLADAVAETVDL